MGQNLTTTVKNLLLINIIIFLVQASGMLGIDFAHQFGLHHINSPYFQPYQIITHIFMHANLGHIFSNMFALFIFGPILENMWGSKRFLIFYMVCGLGASILHSIVHHIEIQRIQEIVSLYVENPTPWGFENIMRKFSPRLYTLNQDFIDSFLDSPTNTQLIAESKRAVQAIFEGNRDTSMVGASGAIFGLLAAFALIFPNLELMLLFPPIPVKAKYLISVYMLVELYMVVANRPDDNVAHFAHLGGAFFGYIMLRIWFGNKYRQY
jgi:membrane associated rhomboid family serine protease